MLQILLHSSKTMRVPQETVAPLGVPRLLEQAEELVGRVRQLTPKQYESVMQISAKKAADVQQLYASWSADPHAQVPAIDSFIGDIYSGLQVQTWSEDDRAYAHKHLLILSGLYGGLRACDGIMPYRLEMAYKLPGGPSLYAFWGDSIATLLPKETTAIINLSSVEYSKTLLPYTDVTVVAPKFLTVSPKTGEPAFVTVHAKIARGAFARWLLQRRVDDMQDLKKFDALGYVYDADMSMPEQPVFVCQEFQGLGLSVRLAK